MEDSYQKIFGDKQVVMFVFAHPDDAEVYAGGTIKRLTEEGKKVVTVKVTSGNRGSRQSQFDDAELASTRLAEDKAASEILGVQPENSIYLNLHDGEVENSVQNIERIARLIRKYRPDLVVTHNPEDVIIRSAKDVNWVNHRDHMHTGLITTYAVYPYSRDVSFFPHHFEEGDLKSHEVTELMYVDYYDHPDLVGIDITDYYQNKIDALAAHASQFERQSAEELCAYFCEGIVEDKKFERFRYVIAD